MKKYFLLFGLIIFTIISCNQLAKKETAPNFTTGDSGTKSAPIPPTEMLKVSDLSPEELKDDSIFADGSVPASWENAGITNVKGLKLFIKKLQQWIVLNDKDSLASVVKYPLNKTIKTKEQLVANYDAIFTKKVKLSFATLNFSQLFRNTRGVMTGDGDVWIRQENKTFKIVAINN